MKTGDKVCVKIDGKWIKGTVIQDNKETIKVGIGEAYRLNYYRGDFSRNNVKRFLRINEEEAEMTHRNQFDNLLFLCMELKNRYFINKKVDVDRMVISIENFNLGPCIMEVETIGAIMEVAGWSLDASVYYDSVDGFPDVDVVDLGKWRDSTEAVTAMMRNLFDADMKAYLEKKAEDNMAKMMLSDLPF